VNNAAKHAGEGATITVSVSEDASWLSFAVADDGLGFDLSTVAGGQGFDNMRDRVGAYGGDLFVESSTGHGACVRGRIPLPTPGPSSPPPASAERSEAADVAALGERT
jgi:signal transduction histidine kinase